MTAGSELAPCGLAPRLVSILYTLRALVALLAEVGERCRFKLVSKCATPRGPLICPTNECVKPEGDHLGDSQRHVSTPINNERMGNCSPFISHEYAFISKVHNTTTCYILVERFYPSNLADTGKRRIFSKMTLFDTSFCPAA